MAEVQPPNIVEGATTGDVEDEIQPTAKSAEDRKAAAALSSLDTREDDSTAAKDIDQEAVKKAMDRLAGTGGSGKKVEGDKKEVKKVVKVDQSDVLLIVSSLSSYSSVLLAFSFCWLSTRTDFNVILLIGGGA